MAILVLQKYYFLLDYEKIVILFCHSVDFV